jgi:hypothetical protein
MFQLHRIFCATPRDMEAERSRFYDTVAEFNETNAMPQGILFVPVSLNDVRDKRAIQHAVDENIRDCRYYVRVPGGQTNVIFSMIISWRRRAAKKRCH